MYSLTARLEIDSALRWRLDQLTEAEVVRSVDNLTATARISLPKQIRWNGAATLPLRHGDAVRLWLGYDGRMELAFSGYIRRIGLKTPVVLECEDDMYQLKQQPAQRLAYTNASIEQLLRDQSIGYPLRVMGEQRLGAYRVQADTVASMLGQLGQQGIRAFFVPTATGSELCCGVLFDRDGVAKHSFATGRNIIDDRDLKQQRADDMRICVHAIGLMPDNKRIHVQVGDADGERRTLHTYNKTEAELRAWAEQEVARLKRDGLCGRFTTFGGSLVGLLDMVSISIDGHSMGTHQVQANTIKYGTAGFRQEITIG